MSEFHFFLKKHSPQLETEKLLYVSFTLSSPLLSSSLPSPPPPFSFPSLPFTSLSFIFFKNIYLFIYLVAPGLIYLFIYLYLFLAVLGLRLCARALSSCGKWGPLFIAVSGPLHYRGLSCCGTQAPDAQAQ